MASGEKISFIVEVKNFHSLAELVKQINVLQRTYSELISRLNTEPSSRVIEHIGNVTSRLNFLNAAKNELFVQSAREATSSVRAVSAMQAQARAYQDSANAIQRLSTLSAQYEAIVRSHAAAYGSEAVANSAVVAALAKKAQHLVATAQKYGVAQTAVERFGVAVARAVRGLQTGLVGPGDFVRMLDRQTQALSESVVRSARRYSHEIDGIAAKQRMAAEIMTESYRKVSREVIEMANSHYVASRAVAALQKSSSVAVSHAPIVSNIIQQNNELINSARAHNIGENAIRRYAIQLQRLNSLYRQGVIDAQRYVSGIRAASAALQGQLSPALAKVDFTQPGFFANLTKGISGFFVKLGVGVFVFSRLSAGARYLTDTLSSLVNAYADVVEAQNFLNVAFGNSAESMKKWIDSVSASFFMNPAKLMQTVAQWKLILQDIGLSESSAIWTAKVFQKLAIDVASLRNAEIDKVTEAMISGLQGNIRPLRALGIDVSKATLEFYALASGIKQTSGELSTFERVMSVAMAVLVATSSDRGDFVATMGTTKNQLRVLNEQWQVFKQRLGESIDKSTGAASVISKLTISLEGLRGILSIIGFLLGGITKLVSFLSSMIVKGLVRAVSEIYIAANALVAIGKTAGRAIVFDFDGARKEMADLKKFVFDTHEDVQNMLQQSSVKLVSASGSFVSAWLGGATFDESLSALNKQLAFSDALEKSLLNTGKHADRIKAILKEYGDEFAKIAEGGTDVERSLFRALRMADEFSRATSGKATLPAGAKSIIDIPDESMRNSLDALQKMMRAWGEYKDKVRTIQDEIAATDEMDIAKRIELYRAWEAESNRMAQSVSGVFKDVAVRDARKAASEITALQRKVTQETLSSVESQASALAFLMKEGIAPADATKRADELLAKLGSLYKQSGKSSLEISASMAEWGKRFREATSAAVDYDAVWEKLKQDIDSVNESFKGGLITREDAVAMLRFYQKEFEKLFNTATSVSSKASSISKLIISSLSSIEQSVSLDELKNTVDAMESASKSMGMKDKERLEVMRELYAEISRIVSRLREQITDEETLLKLKELQEKAAQQISRAETELTVEIKDRLTFSGALSDIGKRMGQIFSQQLSSSFVDAFGSGNVFRALMRSFKSLGVALGKAAAGGFVELIFGRKWTVDGKTYAQSGLIPGVFGFEDFWQKLSSVQKGQGPAGMSGSQIQGLMMLGTMLQAFGNYRSNRGMSAFGGALTGASAYMGYVAAAKAAGAAVSFNPIIAIVVAILMAIVGWFAGNGKEQIKYAIGIRAGRAVVDEIYRMTKNEERAVQEQLQGRFDDIRNSFESVLIKLRQKVGSLVFSDISFGTIENKRETVNFQNALQAILQSELPQAMLAQAWPVLSSALQAFGVQGAALRAWKQKFDTEAFDKVMPKFVKFVELLVAASDASQKFGRSLEQVIKELEEGSFAAWSGDFAEGFQKITTTINSLEGASIDTTLDALGESLDQLGQLYEQALQFLKQMLQLRRQIEETISSFLKEFSSSLTKKENWSSWKNSVIDEFNAILQWLRNPPENVQPEDVQKKVGDLMNNAKQIEEIINYIASAVERLTSALDDISNIIDGLSMSFTDFAAIEGASAAWNFRKTFSGAFHDIEVLGDKLKSITDPAEYANTVDQIREHAKSAAEALKEFGRAIISAEKNIHESIENLIEDINISAFDKAGDVAGKGTYIIEQMKRYREMIASATSPDEVQYLVEQVLKYAQMLRGMGDQILLDYNGQQMSVDEWLRMMLPGLQEEADAQLAKFKEEWENSRNALKQQLEGLSDDVASARDSWKAEMDALIELIKTGLGEASSNAVSIINGFIDAVGDAIEKINALNNAILLMLQTLEYHGIDPDTGGTVRTPRRRLIPGPGAGGQEPPEPPEPPRPPIEPLGDSLENLSLSATDAYTAMNTASQAALDFARTLNAINGNVQITLSVDPAILVDVDGRADLVRVVRRS